jgi:hypothetical protein
MPRIQKLIFVETHLPLLAFPPYLRMLLTNKHSLDLLDFLLDFANMFGIMLDIMLDVLLLSLPRHQL